MNSIDQLDAAVSSALKSLAEELKSGGWEGKREREVVSLFCFGHLLARCRPATVLHDPAQISIEVAVPQIPEQKQLSGKVSSKTQVCKDIVIWPRPRMTCWDANGKATIRPLSIIEWKHNEPAMSGYDMDWLRRFSEEGSEFVGYAVSTKKPAKGSVLSCTRVSRGERVDQWVHIP